MPIITEKNLKTKFMARFKKDEIGKKILRWLDGERVDDSAMKPNDVTEIDFSIPNKVSLTGAFGTVSLKLSEKKDYDLKCTRNYAGPLTETVTDFDDAVFKFIRTSWHIPIRGVIM